MKYAYVLALAAIVATSTPVPVPAAESEQAFIERVIQSDIAEVQIGRLAQQNGGNAVVKNFGKALSNDHAANLPIAKRLAKALGVVPPVNPSSIQEKEIEKLANLNGSRFDKELAREMIADHRQNIQVFSAMAKDKQPDVADFAKRTLPTLHKHLQMAEAVQQQG